MNYVVFIIVSAWIVVAIAIGTASTLLDKNKKSGSIHTKRFYKRPVSSDGHAIPRKDDITCANIEDHYHRPSGYDKLPRYIVHEEPETGYVILNGKKRRLTDCKYL